MPINTGPLKDKSIVLKGFAYVISTLLPYLGNFDMKEAALFATIKVSGTAYASDPRGITPGALWGYVGIATLYAIAYAFFALSAGMWSFQTRELGGGEG
jgi:hypothetical protein